MGKKTTKEVKSSKKKESSLLTDENVRSPPFQKKLPLTMQQKKNVRSRPFQKKSPLIMIDIPNLKGPKEHHPFLLENDVVVKLNKPPPCKNISFGNPEMMDFTMPRSMKSRTYSSHRFPTFLKEHHNSISELGKLIKPMPEKCNCGNMSPSELKMISMLLSGSL